MTARAVLAGSAATLLLAACAPAGANPPQATVAGGGPGLPIRAAFVYPWFPEGWAQRSLDPFSRFHPSAGRYDSGRADTVTGQVDALAYAGVGAAIVSWWGPGAKSEQQRIPLLLDAGRRADPALRFALYYEKEGTADPPVDELVADLRYVRDRYAHAANYLRIGGRPVLFVYNADDTDCSVVDRWSAAAAAVDDFYLVLKVFPGWDACRRQPAAWHQYAPADASVSVTPHARGVAGSVSVSPGFWRAGDPAPLLPRDLRRWRDDVTAMARSQAPWQLVTTFNEWGEGTAVESAREWASPSGQGSYLDVLHENR